MSLREWVTRLHAHWLCRRGFDALTRVRAGWAFQRDLARAQETPGVLALVDLDCFKLVNLEMGWVAGDRILFHVAQSLCAANEPRLSCYRVAGARFALLGPGNVAEVAAQLRSWRSTWAQALPAGLVGRACVEVSVGIAALGRAGRSALDDADVALWVAKCSEHGLECYVPAMADKDSLPSKQAERLRRMVAAATTDEETGFATANSLSETLTWNDREPAACVRVALRASGQSGGSLGAGIRAAVAKSCAEVMGSQGVAYVNDTGALLLWLRSADLPAAHALAVRLKGALDPMRQAWGDIELAVEVGGSDVDFVHGSRWTRR